MGVRITTYIGTDNEAGGRLAADTVAGLVAAGARVALITGLPGEASSAGRRPPRPSAPPAVVDAPAQVVTKDNVGRALAEFPQPVKPFDDPLAPLLEETKKRYQRCPYSSTQSGPHGERPCQTPMSRNERLRMLARCVGECIRP